MSYWQRLKNQIWQDVQDAKPVLRDYDVSVSVATDGEEGQTLSMRSALGARKGIWRWCVLCRLLSWFVQINHCEETLNPDSIVPTSVYWRAGLCFVAVTAAVIAVVLLAIHAGVMAACAAGTATAGMVARMINTRPGVKPVERPGEGSEWTPHD